jgi:hypothetical protein
MTTNERSRLKRVKKEFKKSQKNRVLFNNKRNELIEHILKSSTPKWGSFKLGIINYK